MKLITTSLKFIYIFFLILSLFLFLLAYYFSNTIILDSFKEQISNHYETIYSKLNSFHTERYNLLHTLVYSNEMIDFLENKQTKKMERLFTDFAKANSFIMQMRVLDLKGNELFRLDQNNKKIIIKKKNELQNKQHRYYFQEFLKLSEDKLGISKLDLNVENKKIEIPFNPTVRLAMPIYEKNEKKAILIINYQMKIFLEDIFKSSFFDIYLLDENGYFITHEKKEYQWSKYTNGVKYNKYFNGKILSQIEKKEIELWGSKFFVLYNPRDNSSIIKFINYSWIIGLLIAFAVFFILIPFLHTLYLNYKKIKEINFSLEDTKKQLESILNNTSDAIFLIDLNGIIQEVNQSAQKIFGYERVELIGENINILVPEPHHDKHDEYIAKHDKNMRSKIININRELYGLHKDGSFINIGLTVTKVEIDEKQYFIGTIQNLSKEQKSRKLFENVFSETSIGIALVLSDGSFWRINSKFCEIVEYSYDELINLTFQDITHKDDIQKDISLVKKVLNKEISNYNIQKRYITKSGRIVWVKLTVVGVFSDYDKNQFDYFIATVDDISKQVITQEKLQEAEKIAQIGHWFYNLKTTRLEWSDNMKKIFGKTSKNFNHTYDDFIMTVHKDDRDYVNEQVNKSLEKQNTFDITYRILVDDKIKYIHALGKVTYKDDKPIEFFGVCQDITQIKELENETKQREMLLLEQSKLASMGEMIGAIAHQWRQPLNSIGFIVQDMISAYKHNELDEEYMQEIKVEMMQQLNYMSDTIDEFRNFFKKDEPLKSFNVLNSINDVLKLYYPQLNAHSLKLKIIVDDKRLEELSQDDKNHYIMISQEGQLKQVIINCISNIKEALEVQKNLLKEQKEIIINLKENKKNIIIIISDLAGGITKENIRRIFEPYFTTKNMGTGLGLYICKTICEKSLEGEIIYEQREEIINDEKIKGSNFIITLPKIIE